MGFRRLRGRLQHMENDADQTMQLARDLIADIQDGVSIKIEFDTSAAMDIVNKLISGVDVPGKFTLPITIRIEP